MKNTYIFDNEGESFDRYTIILPNGDILGASENPFHPLGFGQHCANCLENYFKDCHMRPKNLSKTRTRQIIRSEVQQFRRDGNLGKEIFIKHLPAPVIEFINQNLS